MVDDTDGFDSKPRGSSKTNLVYFCDIPLVVTNLEDAYRKFSSAFLTRKYITFRFVNAFSISTASKNPLYQNVLRDSGLNFPDSSVIVRISNLFSLTEVEKMHQIRGIDFMRHAFANSDEAMTHNFIGTNTATLETLKLRIKTEYPTLKLGFFFAPDYTSDLNLLVEQISSIYNPRDCDVTWLSLGTPKQDLISSNLSKMWGKPVISVGAAFDFLAGTISEAPNIMVKLSLEWLYRLMSEPRRLWRRYFLGNFHFLYIVIKYATRNQSRTKSVNIK